MFYLLLLHILSSIALLVIGATNLAIPKGRDSLHSRLGNVYFWLLTISLPAGFLYGVLLHPGTFTIFQWVAPPTYLMGLIGYLAVKLKPRAWLGLPWLFWHIEGQAGSYIGVVTATAFQFFPRVFAGVYGAYQVPVIILLAALPTLLGSILILRTVRKWVKVAKE